MTTTKTMTTTPPTAADLVAILEAIALGSDITAAVLAAETAIAMQRAAAVAEVFRPAISADAAAWLALRWHEERSPSGAARAGHLAALHAPAIEVHAELAGLIRSIEVRTDCARAAPAGDADAAVETFDTAICQALIAVDHASALPARSLLASYELAGRVRAVEQRHREHARAEAEAREREAREAEQAELDALVDAARQAIAELAARAWDEAARPGLERSAKTARGRAVAALLRRSGQDSIRLGGLGGPLYDAIQLVNLGDAGMIDPPMLDAIETALATEA